MPVPNVYESTTAVEGVGALSVPWGTHNDTFVAILVVHSGGATIATPTSGDCTWTRINDAYTGTDGAAGSVGLAAFWAKAVTGTMGNATVADSGDHTSARMFMLQNVVASGNPINISSSQVVSTATATISMAGGTTTVVNCLNFCLAGHAFDQVTNPGGSGWTNAALDAAPGYAGFFATDNGTGGGYQGGNGEKAVAGSLGTWAHTWVAGATKQANVCFSISDTATTAPANYTLTAAAGTFALAGSNADLRARTPSIAPVALFDYTSTSPGWFGEQGSISWFDADVNPAPVASGTYTLTAEAGTLALTGTDAGLRAARLVGADAGSFALTGTDAGVFYGRKVAADAGTFALTGTDAGLSATRRLAADAGTVALTGTDAGLFHGRRVAADGGTYALTGDDAGLRAVRLVSAEAGSYALTGTAAGLLHGRLLTAEAGSFVAVGTAADLRVSRVLSADGGTFAVTGTDAGLLHGRRVAADSGAYALTGTDATLTYSGGTLHYTLTAEAGTFALTGAAAGLLVGRRLTADAGTAELTGTSADLRVGRVMGADSGAYALTGTDAGVRAARLLGADAGAFALTGTDAGLRAGRALSADAGTVALNGIDAGLRVTRVMSAEAGAYVVTGADAVLLFSGGPNLAAIDRVMFVTADIAVALLTTHHDALAVTAGRAYFVAAPIAAHFVTQIGAEVIPAGRAYFATEPVTARHVTTS